VCGAGVIALLLQGDPPHLMRDEYQQMRCGLRSTDRY
jgi:hypothetical protein